MRFNVLGLGESIKEYTPDENKTIGVNDVFKFHPVDYLVCCDPPKRFSADRLTTIIESTPCKFFTYYYEEWRPLITNLQGLSMSAGYDFTQLDNKNACLHSNNSVFVACVLAYKMGATNIVIYGADFNTHPNFEQQSINTAIKHFKELHKELKKRHVNLFICTPSSRLSKVLPVLD